MKKIFTILSITLFIFLVGCSDDKTTDEEPKDLKEATTIKEAFPDEEFVEIIELDMDPHFKGNEFLTQSMIDNEGHPNTVFRVLTFDKKELVTLFKDTKGYNENSPYKIADIMPHSIEDTNFAIVTRTTHPNQSLYYFVIGKPAFNNDIGIVINNDSTDIAKPVPYGEFGVEPDRIQFYSEDRTSHITTYSITDTNIIKQ